jgi:uncharacterized protein (DUF302 family)
VLTSRYDFTGTLERLRVAISATGSTLFAEIDQRAAALAAGLTLRPTTLLVFGNPKAGTPLMEAMPLFALALPLKILVWEDAGVVRVAYDPPMRAARTEDVRSGDDPRVAALGAALARVASAVEA